MATRWVGVRVEIVVRCDVGLAGMTGREQRDVVDVVQHIDRHWSDCRSRPGDGELDRGVIGRIGERDVVEHKGLAVSAGIERGGAVGLDVELYSAPPAKPKI